MSQRPQRCQLPDFSGCFFTLPDNPQSWIPLTSTVGKKDILLCGWWPGKPDTLTFLDKARHVYWLQAPETRDVLRAAGYADHIPDTWQAVDKEQARTLLASCAVWFYRPNLRLAPHFWGSFMGLCEAAGFTPTVTQEKTGRPLPVVLPGNASQLLHPCLVSTLRNMGYAPIITDMPQSLPGQSLGQAWDAALAGQTPRLVLAVNGRGLDGEGRLFHFFQNIGTPVAIWFVDNPWHVVSGWRLPWWKKANLFVTDVSFIPSLQACGAEHVWHLPLAVAPHMLQFGKQVEGRKNSPSASPLFVGRSSFPDRERFFAAAKVPPNILDTALQRLHKAGPPCETPHFYWWCEQLQPALWPSHDVRNAGYGAEQCALANRTRWLAAGLKASMTILGDDGWRTIFPNAPIAPPVDYYTALPQYYATAQCVLNVTSLLLPHSLSQRHFDVWAAGGLLLSDDTQGLEIFPRELVAPIVIEHPDKVAEKIQETFAKADFFNDLRNAWREHLVAHHTYTHRIQTILQCVQ